MQAAADEDDEDRHRRGGDEGHAIHVEGPPGGPRGHDAAPAASSRRPGGRRRRRGPAPRRVPARARLGRVGRSRARWSCHPSFVGDRRRVGLDGRAQRPGSRSAVSSGPCRPGCRACRRSRRGAGPRGGARRRPPAARPTGVGTPDRARRGRRSRRSRPGPAGPSTGRTRTFAVHVRRRLASA